MTATSVAWGFVLALFPAAAVVVFIERYEPPRMWRMVAWGVVVAVAVTPLLLAAKGVILWTN